MKLVFIQSVMVLMSLGLAHKAFAFEQCNLPVQSVRTDNKGGGVVGDYDFGGYSVYWYTTEIERSPKGTCDLIGHLKGQSVLDCRNGAKAKGYDCYQVTSYEYTKTVESRNTTTNTETIPLCYACIH
jgi:hypothetical protein